MIPFYINAFLLLFIDVIICYLVRENDKRRKYICIFNTIQIIFFVSLRGETVGNDTQNYINFFRQVVNNPNSAFTNEIYEVGFRWYVYIIAKITSDPRIFLTVGAILSIVPFGIIIYKYSKDCILSFYTFCSMEFILFSMTGMRQNIAYFFVYLSFLLILSKKKKIKIFAIFLIIMAGFFHKSAWSFFILYILMLKKQSIKIRKIFYLLGLLIAFIFKNQIGNFFVNYFYSDYQVVATGAYSRVLMVLLVLIFCIFYYNLIIYRSEQNLIQSSQKCLFPYLVDSMFLTTFFLF